MCGIAGYIGKRPIDLAKIQGTLQLMRNRGPDHQGFETFQDGDTFVVLLHSRLSIIDLDLRSNQPFFGRDTCLVYNGEIYNSFHVFHYAQDVDELVETASHLLWEGEKRGTLWKQAREVCLNEGQVPAEELIARYLTGSPVLNEEKDTGVPQLTRLVEGPLSL